MQNPASWVVIFTFRVRCVQMLATLSRWVDEVPPSQQSLRYGNPAYRHGPSAPYPQLLAQLLAFIFVHRISS